MDLRTIPECYDRVAVSDGASASDTVSRSRTASLLQSISLVREWRDTPESRVDRHLEFRTTCAPGVVTPEDLETIPLLPATGDRWILNQFRPGNCLKPKYDTLTPYPPEVLLGALEGRFGEALHVGIEGLGGLVMVLFGAVLLMPYL